MKSLLTGAVVAAALFIPALAEGHSVVVSGMAPMYNGGYQLKTVKVTYDLDPATPQGAEALLSRISTAARLVCGERSSLIKNSERTREFDACRARATAQAVEAVGVPDLVKIAATR